MPVRLTLPKAPEWLDLDAGVRLKVCPCTTPLWQVARARAARRLDDLAARRTDIEAAGGEVRGIEDLDDPDARTAMGEFLLMQELAAEAVMDWDGVIGDDGAPALCTPESVRALMMLNGIAQAFMALWPRHLEAVIAEGKSSPAGPSGISDPAGKATAPAVSPSSPPPAPPAPTA